jgi:hypothetical protein
MEGGKTDGWRQQAGGGGVASKSDREVGGGSDCRMEMSQAWGRIHGWSLG